MIKKRTIRADELIDGMLIELDDDIPETVKNVVKTADRVMFDIGKEKFCVSRFSSITQVVRLTLICGGKNG